jgi:hypothetical protein
LIFLIVFILALAEVLMKTKKIPWWSWVPQTIISLISLIISLSQVL